MTWPGSARSAVALAFDLDGPTGDAMLSGAIWQRPAYFSLGGYGPWRGLVGAARGDRAQPGDLPT